jgi:hypothetical protein
LELPLQRAAHGIDGVENAVIAFEVTTPPATAGDDVTRLSVLNFRFAAPVSRSTAYR